MHRSVFLDTPLLVEQFLTGDNPFFIFPHPFYPEVFYYSHTLVYPRASIVHLAHYSSHILVYLHAPPNPFHSLFFIPSFLSFFFFLSPLFLSPTPSLFSHYLSPFSHGNNYHILPPFIHILIYTHHPHSTKTQILYTLTFIFPHTFFFFYSLIITPLSN